MKSILVPIDFSENARNALRYAQELALYLNARIEVIHVMHPSVNTSYPFDTYDFNEEVALKKKKLTAFVESQLDNDVVTVLTKATVKSEVKIGFAAEEIVNQAAAAKVDFIVMGTTGTGGVLDKLLGSISTIVAKKSTCPILLVPQTAAFKDYKRIMYASDFHSSTNEMLKAMVELSQLFEAAIHLVHVQPEQAEHDLEIEELILNQIAEAQSPPTEIKLVTVWDTNIWHGLNVYARDHGIDLMVLVRPKRTLWDRILHPSVTKKMIKDSTKPILILPTEN